MEDDENEVDQAPLTYLHLYFSTGHQTLVKELLSLPVRADSLSICSRRTQLDRRLFEMEEAIKIFSRDKVFIKTDS